MNKLAIDQRLQFKDQRSIIDLFAGGPLPNAERARGALARGRIPDGEKDRPRVAE